MVDLFGFWITNEVDVHAVQLFEVAQDRAQSDDAGLWFTDSSNRLRSAQGSVGKQCHFLPKCKRNSYSGFDSTFTTKESNNRLTLAFSSFVPNNCHSSRYWRISEAIFVGSPAHSEYSSSTPLKSIESTKYVPAMNAVTLVIGVWPSYPKRLNQCLTPAKSKTHTKACERLVGFRNIFHAAQRFTLKIE
mmetsp:Transcript_27452/g.51240  ORF Transcript_27452/g.51240 Transcript_27452/m.51240 type:complete len:189 (-) Transcript_27452:84-650(-)